METTIKCRQNQEKYYKYIPHFIDIWHMRGPVLEQVAWSHITKLHNRVQQ